MPRRPGRGDHAVERAVHALDLEDGAGAGRRLHGGAQAGRVVAALAARCSPTWPSRPASRRASSTSCRGSARRSARRSSSHPRRAPRLVHRLARDRPAHRRRGGAATSCRSPAELGGKGPLIVFADADLDAAARRRPPASTTTPARCASPARACSSRQSVRDAFLERFHAYVDEHVLGDPRDDATTVSPLIHPEHLERVDGLRRAGARRRRHASSAAAGSPSRRAVVRADADRAALQRLGDRPARGLRPGAHLPDVPRRGRGDRARQLDRLRAVGDRLHRLADRAERVGRALRAGTVWVNTFLVRDLTAPFGGVGISGIGREGGDYALDFYSDLKTLQIREGTTA